jgi:hypothetical protein
MISNKNKQKQKPKKIAWVIKLWNQEGDYMTIMAYFELILIIAHIIIFALNNL